MKHLTNACYCVHFDNYDLFAELMEGVKDRGVGVELSFFDDPAYIKRLLDHKDLFKDYYISFHGAHLEVEATGAVGSPEYERITRAFAEHMALMKEFNAKNMVIHTNQIVVDPAKKEELQKDSIHTLTVIAEEAKRLGIQLLVENVGWITNDSVLFDEDEFIALFDKLPPEVGCLIDTGHAIINKWDMKRVIRELGPKIMAYHIHNNNGLVDSHRPIFVEEGNAYTREMFEELFECMEEYTPDADWILEYSPNELICSKLIKNEVDEILKLIKK